MVKAKPVCVKQALTNVLFDLPFISLAPVSPPSAIFVGVRVAVCAATLFGRTACNKNNLLLKKIRCLFCL